MADKLVRIATYENGASAHAAVAALEAGGVRAVVASDAATTALWHMSPALGGIRILVFEADQARAAALLSSDEWLAGSELGWCCAACGELSPSNFRTCWQCGREFVEGEDKHQPFPAEDELAGDEAIEDDNEPEEGELPPPLTANGLAIPVRRCATCARQVPASDDVCSFCGSTREGVPNPYHPSGLTPVRLAADARRGFHRDRYFRLCDPSCAFGGGWVAVVRAAVDAVYADHRTA